MRFLELYDTDDKQDVLINMDKVSKIEPLTEGEGLFGSSTQVKEVGAYLIFDGETPNINVRQTRKEILELTRSL